MESLGISHYIRGQSGSQVFTLQRAAHFKFVHGDVDCPNCKDLFRTINPIAVPTGAHITRVDLIARRPTDNNHWYRCQQQSKCGVQEFSDVNDPFKSCIGTPALHVWRATDDGVGNVEDDIQVWWEY
jgi:hypothetical protein